MRSPTLARAIDDVVRDENCSGCGACALVDSRISMRLSSDGFARPTITADAPPPRDERRAIAEFRQVCPGVTVRRRAAPEATVDPLVGPWIGVWRAHATDPDLRYRGSSGGTLTALATFLVSSGHAARVVAASQDDVEPLRTTSTTARTAADVAATAGSRYAPVSIAATPDVWRPDSLVVGKPCEAAAVRELATGRGGDPPLILSFFCAGVPSQHATEQLVGSLGMRPSDVRAVRYRGHGWPGHFTVTGKDGTESSLSYEESWGTVLGRALQWRCKICPDGVGEAADVTAADFWETDGQGYPLFTDRPGESVLISRTPRGHAAVLAAIRDGTLAAVPTRVEQIYPVQPLQTSRRQTLLGRMGGAILAGRTVPRYRGFGLVRLTLPHLRASIRAGRGTHRRLRRQAGQRRSSKG